MKPIVSIIMGSTSDLPVMEKAAKLLDEMHVPFEMNALSAHRTPEAVEEFAKMLQAVELKSSLPLPAWLPHFPVSLLQIPHCLLSVFPLKVQFLMA